MNYEIITEDTFENICVKIKDVDYYSFSAVTDDVLFYDKRDVNGTKLIIYRCCEGDGPVEIVQYFDHRTIDCVFGNGKLYFVKGNNLMSLSLAGTIVEFEIKLDGVKDTSLISLCSVTEDKFIFKRDDSHYFTVVNGKLVENFNCEDICSIDAVNIGGKDYFYLKDFADDFIMDENKTGTHIKATRTTVEHETIYYLIDHFISNTVYLIYCDEDGKHIIYKVNDNLTTQQILNIDMKNVTVRSIDRFSVYFIVNDDCSCTLYRYVLPTKTKSARK